MQQVKVTSVAIMTTKFIFGMWGCTVDSNAGRGDLSLVLRILLVCGHAQMRSHVSPSMNCTSSV